jgi:hypothetical protein
MPPAIDLDDSFIGVIIFDSVFIKKSNQIDLKKKRNQFKLTGFSLVFYNKNWFGSVFFWFFLFGFSLVFSIPSL